MSIKDIEHQLQGIEMIKETLDAGTLVNAVNEATQMRVLPMEGLKDKGVAEITLEALSAVRESAGSLGGPKPKPRNSPETPTDPQPVVSTPIAKMDPMSLIELSQEWAKFSSGNYDAANIPTLFKCVKSLEGEQRDLFDAYVTMRLSKGMEHDPEGAIELMGGAIDILCECGEDHDG